MKSIYIHIPYCKQKCLYCDFNSYSNKEDTINKYFDALIEEIKSYNIKELNTIYFGGGTPSFVDSKYIREIMSILPKANEVTLELNPGTVNKEKLAEYKNIGINRLSIGLQAIQNDILKEIGRIHTLNDFEEAFKLARSVGFDNINVDLMHGLPNQSVQDFKDSVDYLVKLGPDHISCYSLILHNDVFKNLPTEEDERKMYYYAKEKLKESGYIHYEISNFAKSGKESKHNLVYWNQEEYVGVGAGASSYLNGERYTNVPSIEEYIKRINRGESVNIIEEKQNSEDKLNEYMILKLRLIKGVNIKETNEKFKTDIVKKYEKSLEKLKKLGLIKIDENIYLTDKGLDLANIVWEEFV